MLNRIHRRQSGDTLIEVLVAIAVLGAIITIAYSVMNRGFATAQNSLDRTNAQNVMNGQASLLRAAHKRASNGNPAYWNAIIAKLQTGGQVADGCSSGPTRTNIFFFNPDDPYNPASPSTTGPLVPQTYETSTPLTRQGTAARPGDGMWIELYRDTTTVGSVYTFYIKSCWDAIYGDGSAVQRQAKTIVRLYEP